MKKKIVVATHDGKFHADEVFAIAILKILYKNIKIIRTRDIKKLRKADFRIDVGNKYNSKTKDFDHHQIEFKLKRKNGIPYASVGLVWKHFGRRLTESNEAFEYVDESLIQTIDADDNGIDIFNRSKIFPYTVSISVDSFNQNWIEGHVTGEKNFKKALNFASDVLERVIVRANSIEKGKKVIGKLLKKQKADFIILEKKGLPWKEMLFEKRIKFAIMPSSKDNWVSVAIPLKKGSFKKRKLFPREWAGLEKDLEKKTGVKGASFCHKARFIVAATTKEGAIKLTKLALKK